MPVSLGIKSRLLALQDLSLTENPSGDTFEAIVLGSGLETLDSIPMVLLTQFTQAAGQLAAQGLNVQPGQVFYDTNLGGLSALSNLDMQPLTGTKNGSNLVFTLPSTNYRFIQIFRNGLLVDPSLYGIGGSVLTFQTLTGVASAASGLLNRVSGDYFPPQMQSNTISINLTTYRLNLVTGPSFATLASAVTFTQTAWTCALAPQEGDSLYALYA